MSNLVERLRNYDWMPVSQFRELPGTIKEAADEIDRLTLRLKQCGVQYDKYDDRIAKLEAVVDAVRYLAWDDRGLLLRGIKELCETMEVLEAK